MPEGDILICDNSIYLNGVEIATFSTRPMRVKFRRCPEAFQLAVCQWLSNQVRDSNIK